MTIRRMGASWRVAAVAARTDTDDSCHVRPLPLGSVGDGQGRKEEGRPGRRRHEPAGRPPLRAARQARVRHRPAGHRGEGAARRRSATIKDAYAQVRDGELWLHNVHIPPYGPAARENHEPERPRKLLAHRREIERLVDRQHERGPDARADADLLQGSAREGRDRPRQAARTASTSARRSRSARPSATCSARCARPTARR